MDISKWTVHEIFKHISELPAKDRINALHKIAGLRPYIQNILQITYHKNFNFTLPEGDPPYTPMNVPPNMGLNRLPNDLRKFKYFVNNTDLHPMKREKIFIETLESLAPEESALVLMMKNKKLTGPYKNITRKLVEESIPHILDGEV